MNQKSESVFRVANRTGQRYIVRIQKTIGHQLIPYEIFATQILEKLVPNNLSTARYLSEGEIHRLLRQAQKSDTEHAQLMINALQARTAETGNSGVSLAVYFQRTTRPFAPGSFLRIKLSEWPKIRQQLPPGLINALADLWVARKLIGAFDFHRENWIMTINGAVGIDFGSPSKYVHNPLEINPKIVNSVYYPEVSPNFIERLEKLNFLDIEIAIARSNYNGMTASQMLLYRDQLLQEIRLFQNQGEAVLASQAGQ